MGYWAGWKQRWRRFETAPLTALAKRRVRQVYGRELRHFVDIRVETVRHGGWALVPPAGSGIGVAYSLGVGEDAVFDTALIERFGLEVHAFDPTPRAVAWVAGQALPSAFRFHAVGVAGYDGEAEFVASSDPDNPSFRLLEHAGVGTGSTRCAVRRITTLARQLGHSRIDILKIDIEGAEYAVLDDLLASELVVDQLLIEFHHRFRSIGRAATARAVRNLRRAGYRVVAISPDGREYSLLLQSVYNTASSA